MKNGIIFSHCFFVQSQITPKIPKSNELAIPYRKKTLNSDITGVNIPASVEEAPV